MMLNPGVHWAGKLVLANGSVYAGEFKSDLMEGEGAQCRRDLIFGRPGTLFTTPDFFFSISFFPFHRQEWFSEK